MCQLADKDIKTGTITLSFVQKLTREIEDTKRKKIKLLEIKTTMPKMKDILHIF